MDRQVAVALDEQSPLRSRRGLFSLPDGVDYLDGNSLGPPTRTVAARMEQAVTDELGAGLISSWNDADWVGLSHRVGAKIARLIGVDGTDVHLGDSTTVTLFKTLV